MTDKPLWTPSPERVAGANITAFMKLVNERHKLSIRDYPALYLWNQPSSDGNHTPSWDDFAIPPINIG